MSFVEVSADSDFPIQNLPYGIFRRSGASEAPRAGVAIGDCVLDLSVISDAGLLPARLHESRIFHQSTLNAFMALGRPVWRETRAVLTRLLSKEEPTLRDNAELRSRALIPMSAVEMLLPAQIGDYTDFYASKEHATNVGIMFRGAANALQPNWTWLPVGYHGRSSSVVVSGTPVRRPKGQLKADDASPEPPVHGVSRLVDFEVEVGFFVGGAGNAMGEPISIADAEQHIFGIVLLNDWSARDVQRWEYVPLGPFGAKNWATTISPWIVTLEALEPFRVPGPAQTPAPLEYLADSDPGSYDLALTTDLQSEKMTKPQQISLTNFKFMYWSMKQQLTHHTVTGCPMRAGDLLGSGTISGPTQDSLGSMLEISWKGSRSITMAETGEERKFLADGDTVIMRGSCVGDGYKIGFGECAGKLLPAHK
eukprot:TRINITY_DN3863_c0_g1_i1.p1 TRINITY_DN3863_c0_g1~~TRINITY_DN3863_c0_g1_i1.p1  ORF type:complete len:439 (-),score=122.81 TRINITY_DN3863_c0_g1_i1:215-1483(-)